MSFGKGDGGGVWQQIFNPMGFAANKVLGESNHITRLFGNPLTMWKETGKDVAGWFKKPDMPAVEPLPNYQADNSTALKNAARIEAERLRKRKGMKSTILTQDSSLMAPVQTQKAEALGG